MKKYIIILLGASLFSPAGVAQIPANNTAFKGANTIVIETNLSDSVNFRSFGRFFQQSGISIAESNGDFYSILTKPKPLRDRPGWSHRFFYEISFYNGKIKIIPFWNIGVDIDLGGVIIRDDAIRWEHQKNGVNAFIETELLDLLKNYSQSDVWYIQE